MADKTAICNFSLSHLGISQYVANIETDNTKEARVCRKWWDTAVDFLLADMDWNFNRRYIPLALLSGFVPSYWKFKYAYPSDAMRVRAIIQPGVRNPMVEQRIPFEIAGETSGVNDIKVIYTDLELAVARYSKRVTDTSLFDAQFSIALSYMLASLTAMPLTVKPQIASAMRDAYTALSNRTAANDLNESQEGAEPETLDLVRNG